MAATHFNAYIDEAGDEGFSRPGEIGPGTSSEWLVLGGVIVPAEEDLRPNRTTQLVRLGTRPQAQPVSRQEAVRVQHADLKGYMDWIQMDPQCQISPNCLDQVKPVSPTLKLAQVADFYVSATAAAIEPDANYGLTEEKYLLQVRHQLYRMPGKALSSFGFKVFPDQAADAARFPWLPTL